MRTTLLKGLIFMCLKRQYPGFNKRFWCFTAGVIYSSSSSRAGLGWGRAGCGAGAWPGGSGGLLALGAGVLGAHRGALKAVVGRFVEGMESWGCLVLGASSLVLSHLMKSSRRGGLGSSRVLGVMQAPQVSDQKKSEKSQKMLTKR